MVSLILVHGATCFKELIYDYQEYTYSFPSHVHLTAVIDHSNGNPTSVVPDDEGFIVVPFCFPQHGYIEVKFYLLFSTHFQHCDQ